MSKESEGNEMPQILPIRDLRDTTKISSLCHESDEPIFITKNGYGDMVLLSIEAYENMFARLKMYDAIMAGKKQADENQLLDGVETMNKLGNKYGL